MRHMVAVLAVIALVIPTMSSIADVPEFMSYQGVLRDGIGNPVPDGMYALTFRLYDVETGGVALWTEAQTYDVQGGMISVKLGKGVPLSGVEFDVPYWLGISIGAEPELVPRVELATVPYAAHAAYADRATEGDDDWAVIGDNVFREVGNVGIGTATPGARLDILTGDTRGARFVNGSALGNFTMLAHNYGGTSGGFYAGEVPGDVYPGTPSAVFAWAGPGHRGGFFVSSGDEEGLVAQSQGTGPALRGWAWGSGLSGYFTGGQGVLCDEQIEMAGFKMSTGAVPGHVLTADASGVGTWQSASGSGGDITAVYADGGLYGTATSGDAHLSIGEGVGINVTDDAVELTVPYSTGSAYDARFINEGQANSVNSDMIISGEVIYEDMQNPFDLGSGTWYWSQTTGLFDIDHYGDSYPAMYIDNHTDANDGDCLYLTSQGTMAGSTTYVLHSYTYKGKAGQFTKSIDDDAYAVYVNGASATSEGLYVNGTIVSSTPFVRSVATSMGHEPVFCVDSTEPEVVASGRARLAGGRADVEFDRMFEESVAREGEVRVTVTPIAGWSALYVESTGPEGFVVRSASGETDIDFYWTAVGRSKDAIDRASITLPDPEEERRIEAAKMSARK